MCCKAVHLEVLYTLSSNSFINAMQRLIARRGNVRSITSDNGTNFTGAQRELKDAIADWNEKVPVAATTEY